MAAIARELLTRVRELNRRISELEREITPLIAASPRRCSPFRVAAR